MATSLSAINARRLSKIKFCVVPQYSADGSVVTRAHHKKKDAERDLVVLLARRLPRDGAIISIGVHT